MRKLLLLLMVSTIVHAQEGEIPPDLIQVEKVNYQRNSRASFCMRPIEMVDTIVFHHSQGASTDTPEDINNMHLNRGTPDDPWYMIAYSFVVNSPYPTQKVPDPKVSEGRPLDIVGAHAGSFVYVDMDDEQRRMWSEGKIVCGKEGGEFSIDSKQLDNKGRIKANVTTIGVVVNGNYAKFSRENPTGWTTKNPRYPTDTTLDLLARISCQLQKKYPRMTKLRWHNFYHSTDCPGNIKDYVDQIRTLAKGFGCEFD